MITVDSYMINMNVVWNLDFLKTLKNLMFLGLNAFKILNDIFIFYLLELFIEWCVLLKAPIDY